MEYMYLYELLGIAGAFLLLWEVQVMVKFNKDVINKEEGDETRSN
jgi:hypothetical protein